MLTPPPSLSFSPLPEMVLFNVTSPDQLKLLDHIQPFDNGMDMRSLTKFNVGHKNDDGHESILMESTLSEEILFYVKLCGLHIS